MATVVWADRHEMIRNAFPKNGVVAEIGVQFGRFAEAIHKECEPRRLVLIDSWQHRPGGYEADPADVPDHVHTARYLDCVSRFASDPRVIILKMSSRDADYFLDSGYGFDAIYLDADHTKAGIAADLRRWWPRVARGGVFAGHDYVDGHDFIDVKPAVDQFVTDRALHLMISGEKDWPSWCVRKP